ncbi:DNA-binding transcriptional repressor MngR [Streptomyces sp. YIM 130001]|uniref:GntR family transcriptional regulator n=1 Tax=Streptomyces sp. YIM 130001 TaxID=2259644 RepID=UPI000E64F2B0|nr:winged helix-turn-helix domain-containing protein [Streptomyces sp. YIM 130001]RII11985.1 DNA-binding transcriptional repressor MngR [Streptomyces sp. YIM 130001]
MTIADDDPRPKKVQIADALRPEIAELPKGRKLASVRDLADRFGVTPVTAGSALQILIEEGLIESVPTRGYFVQTSTVGDDEGGSTNRASRDEITAIHSEIRQLAARVAELEKRADHTSSL